MLSRIVFQGRELPPFSIVLDLAANYMEVADIDEETAVWFWKFTICVGVSKKEKSSEVHRHATKLRKALDADSGEVAKWVALKLPSEDPNMVMKDWIRCLEIMLEEAKESDICEWSAFERDKP